MSLRIGINGFGRIGRNVFRIIEKNKDLEVVAINDLSSPDVLAHLLRYDSTHGRFGGKVERNEGGFRVNDRDVKVLAERDPSKLPWKNLKVDFVVESTGVFSKREQCALHLAGGAGKVLLTVPPKDEVDAMIVMGVNEKSLKAEHKIISNASCTTNCLAPMAKVLHDKFGIIAGAMTTIHAYTNDQVILDGIHSDLRRARSAAVNIIPTTTGAARAVGKVMPELKGKLDGCAMRVPIADGSLTDLSVTLTKPASVEEINAAMKAAADGPMKGILEYSTDPLVSQDIVGNPHSSIFDSLSTMKVGDNLYKVVSWYDNEWGYSNRVVDLMLYASKL